MKVLFVGISLKVGGIERALLDQVNDLAARGYQVDLFLFSHTGAYIKDLDSRVNLLPEGEIIKYTGLTHQESKKSLSSYFIRNLLAVIARIKGSRWLFLRLFRYEKKLGDYDIAVSYFNDNGIKSLYYGCNLFVQEMVQAKRKLAWIHSDYIMSGLNTPEINAMYELFDGIVNVSKTMKLKFDALRIVPKGNSYCVYNILEKGRILGNDKALELTLIKKLKIVTVGRLENNKGTMELLQLANNLKIQGCEFKWFFIGQGVLFAKASRYIKDKGLTDYVVLLGQQSNPYSIIQSCDLYVSGSKCETFGISILEALVLSVPVVAYRYDAIGEVLSGGNGIVCDSYEDLQSEIVNLIESEDAYLKIKKNAALLFDYKKLNRLQFDNMIENLKK